MERHNLAVGQGFQSHRFFLDRAELVNIRVGTADIEHGVDYAVADFFARRMKPQCYSTSLGFAGNNALARLSLFGRAPFRDCVEVMSASEIAHPAVIFYVPFSLAQRCGKITGLIITAPQQSAWGRDTCLPSELPSLTFLLASTRLRRCAFYLSGTNSPASWVDRLIEEFEAATVVDKRLENIQLQWTEWDGFPPCTPLLRKPTATNVPIPKNNFVRKGFILDWGEAHESECALYSFDNSAAYRRLNIYNWVTSAPSDEMKHDVHAFLIELNHL